MGIGHTWHLQLHTLSEEEKGQLIYDREFRRAGGRQRGSSLAFPLKTALIQCPQIVHMHSRGVCIFEKCVKI